MTGHASRSLGRAEYARLLEAAGLMLDASQMDEADNHYFMARKAG